MPRVGESLWIAVVIIGEVKSVFDACNSISEIVDGGKSIILFLRFTILTVFFFDDPNIPLFQRWMM